MTCEKCGAEMIANPKKVPGANPKLPDWLCSQANGPCGEQNGQYFNKTATWNPKPKQEWGTRPTPLSSQIPTPVPQTNTDVVVEELRRIANALENINAKLPTRDIDMM